MKRIPLAVFLAYGLLVTWASLSPGGSGALGSWDKLAHGLTYAVFALLGWRLGLARAGFTILCVAIVAYSGLMEFGQSFVPGRMMSGLDLVANTVGVVLGAYVATRLRRGS